MKVSDILKVKGHDIVSLAVGEPVAAAVALLAEHHIGSVLILDDNGSIVGILSERDICLALNIEKERVLQMRVGDLMTRDVATCSPDHDVAAIMGLMTAQRFRHVPVVENGKLVGIVSIGDVVKSRIEEAEAEVDALRRYITL